MATTKAWVTGVRGGRYYVDASGEKRYGQEAVQAARRDAVQSMAAQRRARPGAAPSPARAAQAAAEGAKPAAGEAKASGASAGAGPAAEKAADKSTTGVHADIPKGRTWVEKLPGLPDESWQAHYTGHPEKGGKPTPERQALHDSIKAQVFAKAPKSQEPGPGGKPIAIVTMGGPGSGKSSILKHMGPDLQSRFVHIDADAVKEHLPEFRQATRLDGSEGPTARNAAFMAHEESSHVAKGIRDEAIAGKHNLIFDGTGKSIDSYHGMIKKLKDQGYHVSVVMADLDKDEGKKRALARAERSGRHVPEKIIDDAYAKIPKNFEPIAEMADDFALFNNHGASSRPVYTKSAGHETVYDRPYLDAFRAGKSRAHLGASRRGAA